MNTTSSEITIDHIEYKANRIQDAIRHRSPVEPRLHVIAVVSNPCMYARRYILMRQFVERMERDHPDCILYTVEMAYGYQEFAVTTPHHPRHLQLRCATPLWHKENMINLGVQYLLPPDWKAMAWVDADLEFESATWATDTLRVLNGECDIVQLYSHCIDMDAQGNAMSIFQSGGFMYSKKMPYSRKALRYWHPGYAWACNRAAYDTMGGLYEYGILGSGDNIMMLSLLQEGVQAIHVDSTEQYKDSILRFQGRVSHLRFGYVPGVIRHFFHGSKANRKYTERWEILKKYEYNPYTDIAYDSQCVLVPSPQFPPELADAIYQYFAERNEDEGFAEATAAAVAEDPSFSAVVSPTPLRRIHSSVLYRHPTPESEESSVFPLMTPSETGSTLNWTATPRHPRSPPRRIVRTPSPGSVSDHSSTLTSYSYTSPHSTVIEEVSRTPSSPDSPLRVLQRKSTMTRPVSTMYRWFIRNFEPKKTNSHSSPDISTATL